MKRQMAWQSPGQATEVLPSHLSHRGRDLYESSPDNIEDWLVGETGTQVIRTPSSLAGELESFFRLSVALQF